MNPAEKIRRLNDHARTQLTGSRLIITNGIKALGNISEIIAAVQAFDEFTADNDPYGEHDFGSIEMSGERIFWKFDYYDLSLTAASPDAADRGVTQRVLTIMLAGEY